MTAPSHTFPQNPSRRQFVAAGTTAAAATLLNSQPVHAAGSDQVRIALIGCGGRGSGAAIQAVKNDAGANVQLVAMADAFQDSLYNSQKALDKKIGEQMDVSDDRRFVGLDAYKRAIDCDVDMVLLCSPPGFRPEQFEAAVDAGKHVFMEKPVATDAPGVRRIFAANKIAKEKGLVVAVGHHLRHEVKHRAIVEKIRQGLIGEVQFMRAYFNTGFLWVRPRQEGQTEMQHQIRNWYYFTWTSGDHIVEQHVHDLDVCNWVAGGHPVDARGNGGRQVRTGPQYGEIFDHHSVEFTYANGMKMFSYCRQIPGCWNSFSQHIHGTKGHIDIVGHGKAEIHINGQQPMELERGPDGHQLEHNHLFASLLEGQPYNECDECTASTMTAILGRMATYSGQIISYEDALASEIDLTPKVLEWDAPTLVTPGPEGNYPCAIPGKTKVM